MSVLIDKSTRVSVQGLTGREGTFHANASAEYGTKIVGGVTPGKGGSTHQGWPIFNTVFDAVAQTGADATVIFAPPPFAAVAIRGVAASGGPLLFATPAGIPTWYGVRVWESVRTRRSRLIGP